MILHTLNVPPSSPAFADCLRVIAQQDAILLLGAGVYAALPDTEAFTRLAASGAAVHVLRADAAAAGIVAQLAGVSLVDMDGFVDLTEKYPRQQAWY